MASGNASVFKYLPLFKIWELNVTWRQFWQSQFSWNGIFIILLFFIWCWSDTIVDIVFQQYIVFCSFSFQGKHPSGIFKDPGLSPPTTLLVYHSPLSNCSQWGWLLQSSEVFNPIYSQQSCRVRDLETRFFSISKILVEITSLGEDSSKWKCHMWLIGRSQNGSCH